MKSLMLKIAMEKMTNAGDLKVRVNTDTVDLLFEYGPCQASVYLKDVYVTQLEDFGFSIKGGKLFRSLNHQTCCVMQPLRTFVTTPE